MVRSHENMTPKQKEEALENAVGTLRFLVENGFQGNITFPIYNGAVGKIRGELFMDPKLIPGLLKDKLKQGGDSNASR